jgi:hypothetical protein
MGKERIVLEHESDVTAVRGPVVVLPPRAIAAALPLY